MHLAINNCRQSWGSFAVGSDLDVAFKGLIWVCPCLSATGIASADKVIDLQCPFRSNNNFFGFRSNFKNIPWFAVGSWGAYSQFLTLADCETEV
jgi:hypothetical protein